MPPKAAAKATKPKKVTAQQLAMEQASVSASKLYKQHEELRVREEVEDKAVRDRHYLDAEVEFERLKKDRQLYKEITAEFTSDEALAFKEDVKHTQWAHTPDASRLPNADRENEINTFLGVWRDNEEESARSIINETTVIASPIPETNNAKYRLLFLRAEQGVPDKKRLFAVNEALDTCVQASELGESIKVSRDAAVSSNDAKRIAYYDACLDRVYGKVLDSLDHITVVSLLHYDAVLDSSDGETLMRCKPDAGNTIIKYGLWVKVKEMTRSFVSLVFPDVDIRLDPKTGGAPKLPKAMGLSKENVAVRVYQLAYDPFCGCSSVGKEYYALNCTLKIDLLSFSNRPKTIADWEVRPETGDAHTLHCEEYPPRGTDARQEDPGFRVSFSVPDHIVLRQPALLIGKWAAESREWEPCTHTSFGATFGNRSESNPRRATFSIGELSHFAVLQERTFDVPFESWSVKPLSFDQVLITLETRKRGDSSDREVRVLVRDSKCKLYGPDDAELRPLRESWWEPVTLFRKLSEAGLHFLLADEDAKYVDNLVPKSRALESKAYADMAHFAQFFTLANSRHNKFGEDPDMALFRITRECRGLYEEDENLDIPQEEKDWYSLRYRKQNVAIAKFTEDEEEVDLNVADGHETHFNLYTLLLLIRGEQELREQMIGTNYLLRRAVFTLLSLIRPLTWG